MTQNMLQIIQIGFQTGVVFDDIEGTSREEGGRRGVGGRREGGGRMDRG